MRMYMYHVVVIHVLNIGENRLGVTRVGVDASSRACETPHAICKTDLQPPRLQCFYFTTTCSYALRSSPCDRNFPSVRNIVDARFRAEAYASQIDPLANCMQSSRLPHRLIGSTDDQGVLSSSSDALPSTETLSQMPGSCISCCYERGSPQHGSMLYPTGSFSSFTLR
jgi:hypothetical protein